MTFDEAVATQPQWVGIWIMCMAAVMLITMVGLLFSKVTRRDAFIVILTNVAVYFAMMWLYEQVGYVRLLGIVHVIFWTPLAFYLWRRLKDANIVTPFRQIIWLFLAIISISLAFDYADVARYVLGERAIMTG